MYCCVKSLVVLLQNLSPLKVIGGKTLLKNKNLLLFLIILKVTCEMSSTYTRVAIKLEALFWYHLYQIK